MQFASDNWAGACAEVTAALVRHAEGFAPAYGDDPLTGAVTARFREVFETRCEVWFVATGTAANSLALAAMRRPGGLVFCSEEAHIALDELGATEFQSGGMKLVPLPATFGRLAPAALSSALPRFPEGGRFGQPVALSLTNATELGTVYTPDAVRDLADAAHAAGLAVHLDGARFANAVAATGMSPADLTWRAGVDVMSFGGTKNGCWAAEAIIVFSPDRVRDLPAYRQRAGHAFSKSRFVAAQFEGYLADGAWLRHAGHANRMAERLRAGLRASGTARLGWETPANEVFAIMPREAVGRIRAAGGSLYEWPADMLGEADRPGPGEELVRLVASFATADADVDGVLSLL
jgi:threonine aldolase